jgi:hypothetical protein
VLTDSGTSIFLTTGATGSVQVTMNQTARMLNAIVPESGNNIELTSILRVGDFNTPDYVFVGADAERYVYNRVWGGDNTPLDEYTCPGALPIRLRTGMTAVVIPTTLWLKSEASNSSDNLARLDEDLLVEVQGGVTCADGSTWWRVFDDRSNRSGFLPESVGGEYTLNPLLVFQLTN